MSARIMTSEKLPIFRGSLKILLAFFVLGWLNSCATARKAGGYQHTIAGAKALVIYPPILMVKQKGLLSSKTDLDLVPLSAHITTELQKLLLEKKIQCSVKPMDSIPPKMVKKLIKRIDDRSSVRDSSLSEELVRPFAGEKFILFCAVKGFSQTPARRFFSKLARAIMLLLPKNKLGFSCNFHLAIIDVANRKVLYSDYIRDDLDPLDFKDISYQLDVVFWDY